MYPIFDFFISGNWHYENKNIYQLLAQMSKEEQKEFECDCRKVDWDELMVNYVKGMAIYVLKEEMIAPEHNLQQIIIMNKFPMDDIKETLAH